MEPTDDSHNQVMNKEGETEDLIAELCMNAPHDSVKFCIRNYQHDKTLAQLEKDFELEKRDTLLATAEYLKAENYESKNKKPLAHLIICRIQNLLPDNCTQCNERYRIELNETPLLECAICGQGVHRECWIHLASAVSNELISASDIDKVCFKKLYNPLNLPNIYYICEICKEATIPNVEDGNKKRKKPKVTGNETANATAHATLPTSSTNSFTEDSVDSHDRTDLQISNDSAPTKADLSKLDNDSEIYKSTHRDNNPDSNKKSLITCRFFKSVNCKHDMKGNGCKFTHPKVCMKYTQHGTRQPRGCKLGNRCKDFHPVMCISSLRKGECFSQSCKFNHVKGTKRHPPTTKIRQPDVYPNTNAPTNQQPDNAHQIQQSSQQNPDGQNHFLELIRLLKAEILQTMEMKMTSITNQIQQMQQIQTQPHQFNPVIHPPNLLNPIRPIRRTQFPVPPQIYLQNQSYPLFPRPVAPNQN